MDSVIAVTERVVIRSGGRWNWFEGLSDEALEAVSDRGETVTLAAGASLYHHGQPSDALYQVLKGRIHMRSFSSGGKELLYTHLQPGDCFGELGLIDGQPYHHDADAGPETTLLRLRKMPFQRLRQQFPEIDQQLLQLLASRNRAVYDIIEGALLQDVPHRLARRLYDLLPDNSVDEAEISCSHEDLAKMIGSSRVIHYYYTYY